MTKTWTIEEDKFLRNNNDKNIKQLMKIMNRTKDSIYQRRSYLGLKYSKEHIKKEFKSRALKYAPVYSKRLVEYYSNPMNRVKAGLSKIGKRHTESAKLKMSIARKLNPIKLSKPRKFSEYHRAILKEANKKENKIKSMGLANYEKNIKNLLEYNRNHNNGGMKGKHHSNESIKKIKKARKYQKNTYTTKIELKLQSFLKQLGIEFVTHQYINIEHGYQCDILIPVQKGITKKTIMECDGVYWHNYPIGKDIDHIRTSELKSNGYEVLRLWETDIKRMNLDLFKQKIGEIGYCEYD